MERQNRFDYYKPLTISMVIVGAGLILASLIFLARIGFNGKYGELEKEDADVPTTHSRKNLPIEASTQENADAEAKQKRSDEHSLPDKKEEEIKNVPLSASLDEPDPNAVKEKELTEVEIIKEKIQALEVQLKEYRQEMEDLASQFNEIGELNATNRARINELKSLLDSGVKLKIEDRRAINNEIQSNAREMKERYEFRHQVIQPEMNDLELKAKECFDELDSLQEKLDVLQGSSGSSSRARLIWSNGGQ